MDRLFKIARFVNVEARGRAASPAGADAGLAGYSSTSRPNCQRDEAAMIAGNRNERSAGVHACQSSLRGRTTTPLRFLLMSGPAAGVKVQICFGRPAPARRPCFQCRRIPDVTRRIAVLLATLLFCITAPIAARADEPYVICRNQTYALCASASAFVYGDVAYAKCVIKRGNSISSPPLTYTTATGQTLDICNMNAIGVRNGYMMSTFSLPLEVRAGGKKALYTCPGGSTAQYAQCDGGTCFKSTSGKYFPGVGKVAKNEIICSCPMSTPANTPAPFSYQFIGPYPCQQEALSVCNQDVVNGSIIPVGSPPGAGRVLTEALYGHQFPINECN